MPAEKKQFFCPCSRVLNWSGKGLMYKKVVHMGVTVVWCESIRCTEITKSSRESYNIWTTHRLSGIFVMFRLSLEEAAGFTRDAFGRQSMSEKRHATLDAKHTDTYQRNKKLRLACVSLKVCVCVCGFLSLFPPPTPILKNCIIVRKHLDQWKEGLQDEYWVLLSPLLQ